MPLYELTYIVRGDTSENEFKKIQERVAQLIKGKKGKILNEELWGKKELAYPIQKQNYGFYCFVVFEIEPQMIQEIDHQLKLIEGLIRYLIVKPKVKTAPKEVQKEKITLPKKKSKPSRTIPSPPKEKSEIEAKTVSEREKVLDKKLKEILKEE